MSVNRDLIAKSDENWECVTLLRQKKPFCLNAAMSRMYYSIFLLVKSSMVLNNENPDLPDVAKMSLDGATGVHHLALKYMRWIKPKLGQDYQLLIRKREQADYHPLPVTQKEFEEAYTVWSGRRKDFVQHLKTIGRLIP